MASLEDSSPVVRVTLSDIYKGQLEQSVLLAEIKGSVALQAQQGQTGASIQSDHETRLRKVESKVYAIPGFAGLLALGSLAYTIFGRK